MDEILNHVLGTLIGDVYKRQMLKNVGVDNEMINKALFTQIGIYFIVPLSLAINIIRCV